MIENRTLYMYFYDHLLILTMPKSLRIIAQAQAWSCMERSLFQVVTVSPVCGSRHPTQGSSTAEPEQLRGPHLEKRKSGFPERFVHPDPRAPLLGPLGKVSFEKRN